jgi:hypothetical protein
MGIAHQVSSLYNPSSNRMAENTVKQIKTLMKKCKAKRENFDKALIHYNATKRSSGAASPGAIFYKRSMRTSVLGLADQPFDLKEARKERERDQISIRKYARGIKEREAFSPGDVIVYKEPHKGKSFSKRGTMLSVRKGGRSYEIRSDKGKVTVRNNKYVRRAPEKVVKSTATAGHAVTRAVFSLTRDTDRAVSCVVTTR